MSENFEKKYKILENKPIAYFATEYAITDDLPIYAGGLGILTGDIIEDTGGLGVPFVAFGLLYSEGFKTTNAPLTNIIDPAFAGFEKVNNQSGEPLSISVDLYDEEYLAHAWEKKIGSSRIFLLDFNLSENSNKKNGLIESLYPKDFQKKLEQELLFGIGSIKLIRALNIEPSFYHLNEGHTAFVLFALAVEYMHDNKDVSFTEALKFIKSKVVATKHTPLPDAGLFFTKDDIRSVLNHYLTRHGIIFDDFFSQGTADFDGEHFSTTRFLLRNSIRASAVSKMHAVEEDRLHPHSTLIPITNGVSKKRWQAEEFENIDSKSDEFIWNTHKSYKKEMAVWVKKMSGVEIDPEIITIVWARRLTPYKRPEMLFSDMNKLSKLILDHKHPVQVIVLGDANISDENALALLLQISDFTKKDLFKNRIIYIPKYGMSMAKVFSKGADIWLNTPIPEKEASGTSGMKAGLNGVLNLTTNGGWIPEAKKGSIGWVISDENSISNMYEILENDIVPMYYEREGEIPKKWIQKMRLEIAEVSQNFSGERMIKDYLDKLYLVDTKEV